MAGSRRKKGINIGIVSLAAFLIIFFLRGQIFAVFSSAFKAAGFPIWTSSGAAEQKISSYSYIFRSRQSLLDENQSLKDELFAEIAGSADRQALLDENSQLKAILGRKAGRPLILGVILAKPNRSPYDTMVIDLGAGDNLSKGQKVFAEGDILIGEVAEVYADTSLVKLYSTPGEKTDVILSGTNTYAQATGRGGGNFEITLPQGMSVEKGTEAVFAGITPYVLGVVDEVISDARDPFQKILLSSPVNVADLKFVEIER